MTRPSPLMCVVVCGFVASACVPKRAQTPQPQPASTAASTDLVVLLPDPGTTTAGRAIVSNPHGRVELAKAGAGARISPGAAPEPTTLDEGDIQRLFGDALASLPPAPQHFVLYFRFESEELTDESRRLVQDVLKAVKQRSEPDVTAIGHTDTTGTPASNIELGLRRAKAVQAMLVDAGLASASIAVTSHGEGELLVRTADGVLEARNRRVEITVR
jgi:outer membrane protein OmpA-like peptidoglycan-associated protein